MNLVLRDYQKAIIDQAREFFRTGKRRVIAMAPTGSGKTFCASHMIRGAVAKGLRVAFVCDRIELINQSSDRFIADGIPHGVLQADHPFYDPHGIHKVQVVSVQTQAKRNMQLYDLIIIDECFVGSTLISTPRGDKTIGSMRCGDIVCNLIGTGTVKKVFCKSVSETYIVRFTDGTESECTGEHRFFTNTGWVEAGKLEVGQIAFGIEGMRMVWESIRSLEENGGEREVIGMPGKDLERARMLLSIVLEEVEEPNEQTQRETKSEQEIKRNTPSTYQARREWVLASFAATGASSCARGRVGSGSCSDTRHGERNEWLSNLLQDRYCTQRENGRDRDRRGVPYSDQKERIGSKENGIFGFKRVESVKAVERGGNKAVYNLHVSGHPSYFANGVAVHNCHTLHRAHVKLMEANPDSFILGLSATPFSVGLGKHFDGLISPVTAKDLIGKGHLVPFVVYGPRTIDVTGVKTVAGDYDQKELGERADKPHLVANVVQTWIDKGENRQTICFSTNVAHSKHLVKEFQRKGIAAEHIDSFTDKGERKAVLEGLAMGFVRVVSCVDILTKGFDCPVVSCIIQALPTKSLMRHIQQIGRGLRTSPGKGNLIVLDHAGNHERLGFIDDIEFTQLDDGKKKKPGKAKEKEPKEKLPTLCPSCDYMKPAGVRKCPACGLVPEFVADVETEEGELAEIKRNRKEYSVAQKQQFLSGLNTYAMSKGYREGRKGVFGWSLKKYEEKFGSSPSSKIDWGLRGPVSDDVSKFIHHCNIKWAKSQNKEAK